MENKTKNKLEFTGCNYEVCSYCNNIMIGEHRDGANYGCKIIQNKDGKYARLVNLPFMFNRLKEHGTDFVDSYIGCENFKPSNLPAHPDALEVLVQNNPKCKEIPVDPNATETSWDFFGKMFKFIPKENCIDYMKIQ
jgi:hypothetical protein